MIPDGVVTIPQAVLDILGLDSESTVTFVVENGSVRLENPAVFAMQRLRQDMAGALEKAGLTTEADVVALVKEVRSGRVIKRYFG